MLNVPGQTAIRPGATYSSTFFPSKLRRLTLCLVSRDVELRMPYEVSENILLDALRS